MTLSLFLNMALVAALTTWSPGPNNILLFSVSSKYGFKKNLVFMAGIWTGSLTLMILCGFFCNSLATFIPSITQWMTYIGAAYLIYLAYKTLKRKPVDATEDDRNLNYVMGFFLQAVNVKIIIYGLTMFSTFILPHEDRIPFLLLYAIFLSFMGAVSNILWALFGNILNGFYTKHTKFMNIVMSLLLLWCVLRILGITITL